MLEVKNITIMYTTIMDLQIKRIWEGSLQKDLQFNHIENLGMLSCNTQTIIKITASLGKIKD